MIKEEKEEEIVCTKCGIKTEYSLVLSCNHNLCASCASENLIRNELPGINEIQFVICEKCNTKTGVDTNTSKEILSLGLKSVNKNNNNYNNNKSFQNFNFEKNSLFNNDILDFDRNNTTSNLLDITHNTMNNTNPFKKNIFRDSELNDIKENSINNNICKEHGETLSYLCLDCMSSCICPECVIHGIHKNHEVLNIKKAFPVIYKNMQGMGNNLSIKIKELNVIKNNIEAKKKDTLLLNKKYKTDIRQTFNQIRNLIDKKEIEMINKIDNHLSESINELNNYNNIVSNKLLVLSKLIQNINSYMLVKNKLNLINFYTENKDKIISQIETNELKNLDIQSNLKIEIDKNSFDGLISAINKFNIEINSLKGIIDLITENKKNIGKVGDNLSGKILSNENEIDIKNESNILDKLNDINDKINNI